jgi:hypothetical protein
MYTLNLERSAVSILEQVGVLDTSRWDTLSVPHKGGGWGLGGVLLPRPGGGGAASLPVRRGCLICNCISGQAHQSAVVDGCWDVCS